MTNNEGSVQRRGYQRKRNWHAPQPDPNLTTHTLNENKQLNSNSKEIQYQINENGCHICVSHSGGGDGYPGLNRDRKSWVMSRYVWFLKHGEIDDNLCIMHSCDTPRCINIEHLSLGTHKENMDDITIKGRRPSVAGSYNPNVSLTIDDVINIKKDIVSNPQLRQIDIAKKYNVVRSTISEIQRGVRWSEIEVDGFSPIEKRKTPIELTKDQILEIAANENNLTIKQLSDMYGIAKSTVHIIRSGQTYQNMRYTDGKLVAV